MNKPSQRMTTVELFHLSYGPAMGRAQLADLLGISPGTLNNKISRGEVDIPCIGRGNAARWDIRDVATWWDAQRTTSTLPRHRRTKGTTA